MSIFEFCAQNGNVLLLKVFCSLGDFKNMFRDQCLLSAAQSGHTEAIKYLLENIPSIDPNFEDENGSNAIRLSISNSHYHTAEVLLNDPRIDPNQKFNKGTTLLHVAAEQNDIELMILLMGKVKYSISVTNDLGITPLMIASQAGMVEMVSYLIQQGADINEHDNKFVFFAFIL